MDVQQGRWSAETGWTWTTRGDDEPTLVFAFGIGPVVQLMLRVFDREGRVQRRRVVRELERTPGTVGE